MRGLVYLSWRHLAHNRRASLLCVLCLATTLFLPLGTRLVTRDFERDMMQRARSTPLIAGPRRNRFDLVLAALYFRSAAPQRAGASEEAGLRVADLERLRQSPLDVVVPLNLRHRARGLPIVATSPEYFEQRRLHAAEGGLPLWIGECVLGSDALVDEVRVGETLFSDAPGGYDLAGAVPIELTVTGRLARTGTPDDRALFVSVETGWMLDGALHGHGAPEVLGAAQALAGNDEHALLGPALVEHRAATPDNRSEFHLHAERDGLPLSVALVFPTGAKSSTMLKTRVNTSGPLEVLDPVAVVEELLGYVVRVRSLLDLFALLLGGATLLMGTLVILLSLRLRAGEMRTLERLGASRGMAARLVTTEVVLVLLAALALTQAGLWALRLAFPDLMELLP